MIEEDGPVANRYDAPLDKALELTYKLYSPRHSSF